MPRPTTRPAEGGETLYITERGLLRAGEFGRGVVRHTCMGVMALDLADVVIELCERAIAADGRCIAMVDGYDTLVMETAFRERMTGFVGAHKQHMEVHMLLRSKLLEMALNIANMVMGSKATHAYANVREWEDLGRERSGRPDFARVPIEITEDLAGRFKRR